MFRMAALINLKIILRPLKNSGYSLSDIIKAFLEIGGNRESYNAEQLEQIFGTTLHSTISEPFYNSLSYRIQEKYGGVGKQVSSYSVEIPSRDMVYVIQNSKFSFTK